MSRSWIKKLFSPLAWTRGARLRQDIRDRFLRGFYRPALEQLEDRTLMDAVQWTVATSGFWDVATNWLDTTTMQNKVPTSADTVTINQPGVTVTIRSGSQSVGTLQSADALTITGGSLALAGNSAIAGNLTLGAGTTLTTNGTLTLSGSDTWTDAILAGSGALANQGTLALTGTSGETLSTTLNNTGTITQTGTASLTVNGAFNNEAGGLFDIQAAGLANSTAIKGGGSVTNAGTFQRSVATDLAEITAPFANQGGTLNGETGTLEATNGGANTGGAINALTGATVYISGSFTGVYTGTGGGTVALYNNILIGTGGATFDLAAGLFQWKNNNINLDGNTLTNTGSITISVSGNNLNGNTGFSGGGTANQGGTLDNQGTILQPSGYLYLDDSVILQNEGTYDLTGDVDIYNGSFSPSIVNNGGLFEKTGGTGTSTSACSSITTAAPSAPLREP